MKVKLLYKSAKSIYESAISINEMEISKYEKDIQFVSELLIENDESIKYVNDKSFIYHESKINLKLDELEHDGPIRVKAIKHHHENTDSLKSSLDSRTKMNQKKHQISFEEEVKRNSCCKKDYKCVIF